VLLISLKSPCLLDVDRILLRLLKNLALGIQIPLEHDQTLLSVMCPLLRFSGGLLGRGERVL
jgi:hypothetical protein